MFTKKGQELPGYPYRAVHLGVSFFKGVLSAVGEVCSILQCVNGMPKKDTGQCCVKQHLPNIFSSRYH
jgi:hypothetical protein